MKRLTNLGLVLAVLITATIIGAGIATAIDMRNNLHDQQEATAIMAGDVNVLRSQIIGLGEEPAAPAPNDRDLPASVQGADGPTGATGPRGLPGEDGVDGIDGAQGPTGPAGPAGADGVDGANGANGADGVNGADGANGVDGSTGTQGPEGPTGPAGPMPSSWMWDFGNGQWRRCDLTSESSYVCTPVDPTPPPSTP